MMWYDVYVQHTIQWTYVNAIFYNSHKCIVSIECIYSDNTYSNFKEKYNDSQDCQNTRDTRAYLKLFRELNPSYKIRSSAFREHIQRQSFLFFQCYSCANLFSVYNEIGIDIR